MNAGTSRSNGLKLHIHERLLRHLLFLRLDLSSVGRDVLCLSLRGPRGHRNMIGRLMSGGGRDLVRRLPSSGAGAVVNGEDMVEEVPLLGLALRRGGGGGTGERGQSRGFPLGTAGSPPRSFGYCFGRRWLRRGRRLGVRRTWGDYDINDLKFIR
ncbi:hypothetical protein C4D60_Mb01t01900 [Musa balbisiana]|uniref:Uncharacterized protein n=1 Tax=Musa balbisiana TaxID=52838 RepID=A0A4S8JJF6_MUSBA|nr:hypothetical protein C4D60_Mb01t01900 [Musa balbisiana]